MIMREMKDSGVEWIGEIPSNWKIAMIGSCISEINNPNVNQKESNTLQFKMGEIVSKKDGNSKYDPETIASYNIVSDGAIMINGLNLSFDLISQRVALVKEKGAITSTYLALIPNNSFDSSYVNYLFKSYDNMKVFHSMGRGLRATLSYKTLKSEPIIFPTLSEQQAIATYLDTKCTEIDELITLQETMISELQAYKQSVITEAVTKGLDKNVKLKDSGVEWIGERSEHWDNTKIGRIIKEYKDGHFGSALITGSLWHSGNR